MTKSEAVIRSILGATGRDIRPLARAVDIACDLMFVKNIPMDDIAVTCDIYPAVAQMLHDRRGQRVSVKAATRRIERLANLCWNSLVDRGMADEFLGTHIPDIRAPRDMIFYLAFYVHLDMPFFHAVRSHPALLF